MKAPLLTLIAGFIMSFAYCQSVAPTCGTSQMQSDLLSHNPAILQNHLQLEQSIYNEFTNGYYHSSRSGTYILPVVVHIIHNNGPENISDAQVASAIQHINDAYANTGYYDPLTGVSTTIQFCLAKQDPQGQLTTGINRVQSTLTNFDMNTQDLALKNLSRWAPTCYVNIWIVNDICSSSMGCGVAGYAYFPSAHGSNIDGLVVEANYFGTSPGNTTVAVHELGHYLGLYHTFEGGCTNTDCLADGDKVCDTPPDQSTAAVACSGTANTCSTDAQSGFSSDQSDLIHDYMDYGTPACFNMFTAGQRDRMYWHIDNVRYSLLSCPSCNTPCTTNITANFTPSSTNTTIGSSVTFTNTSTGGSTYIWYINNTQFSTSASPSYNFIAAGTYVIRLKATGTDPNCIDYTTDTITVTCGAVASFNASSTQVNVGQTVTFSNTSTGATSYSWFVDGVQQSTTTNFTYTFNQQGTYSVYLIASNGICSDTTSIISFIHVGGTCNVSFTTNPVNPTTCLGVNFIPDTSCVYSNYLWTFCDPDYINAPQTNLYTTGINGLSACGTMLYKDDDGNYYGFFTNYNATASPCLYRADFGNSMNNTPTYHPITTTGVTVVNAHSFDVMKIGSTYYAFLLTRTAVYRVDLGNSITNTNPVCTQLTGITGLNWAHKLQIVKESNNYWLIVINRGNSNLALLYLGNSITNNVQTEIDQPCNSCWGFDYQVSNGNHYIYVTSVSNGVSAFRFGNSLTNTPTTIPWQFLGQGLNCDIALYKNCDGSFDGVVMKETTPADHALVHLNNADDVFHPLGTLNTAITRVPNISRLIRTDQGLTALVALSAQNGIGTFSFTDCGLGFSTQQFPPTVYYNTPGSYFVHLAVDEGLPTQQTYCTTINVTDATVPPLNLGPDIDICDSTVYTLHAGAGYKTYLWYDGTTDSTNTVYGPGKYYVRVGDDCGNFYSDTIVITVNNTTQQFTLGNDTTLCDATGYILQPTPAITGNYIWQDNSTTPTYNATTSGQYKLTLTTNCGTTADSVQIDFNTSPDSLTITDTTMCGNTIDLDALITGNNNYQWNNGDLTSATQITSSGIYTVTVSNACGSNQKSVQVTLSAYPILPFNNLSIDSCLGDTVTLDAQNAGMQYNWSTGATQQTITVQNGGQYYVTITNNPDCSITDQVIVNFADCNDTTGNDTINPKQCFVMVPTAFSPNGDGVNDGFKPIFTCSVNQYILRIYNRWGELVFETENPLDAWDGTYKQTKQPIGTFVYYMQFRFNGINTTEMQSGNITLLR